MYSSNDASGKMIPHSPVLASSSPVPDGSSAVQHSLEEVRLRQIIEEQRQEIRRLKTFLANLTIEVSPFSCSYQSEHENPYLPYDLFKSTDSVTEQEIADDRDLGIAFPALTRGLTTKRDVQNVAALCRRIMGEDTSLCSSLMSAFFDELVTARSRLPSEVLALERTVPKDWYKEPWYLAYVQYSGVDATGALGDFDSLRKTLPYIRNSLGFRNICLLPHYESPMADGGYDISAYTVRSALGGESAFDRFMRDARELGVRVATDAVFNHTSTEHAWFQEAIRGDPRYLHYYLQRNGREKVAEWDRDGDIICRYRDVDGTITERVVIFPDIDRTHGLWVEIHGRTYQFYRSFYPFQVDLNLQNVDVLTEIFRVLTEDVRAGVLGKRLDAAAHWIKKPGTSADGLDECHAVQALLKSFLRHLHKRAIILPEVVRDAVCTARYGGAISVICGTHCASEGDALFAFEMQAALREACYLQTVAPFWRQVFQTEGLLHSCSVWINLVEHHDEVFLGFYPSEVRQWLAGYIRSHNGTVFRNGMSASGRIADGLDGNENRLASAILMLYLAPGTPMVYNGTEIGRRSQWAHARAQAKRTKHVAERLGVYASEKAFFDGRELHRGPITRCLFEDAANSGYIVVRLLNRLNELWLKAEWMSAPLKPVECDDIGILCATKSKYGTTVLCIVNLTPLQKTLILPITQVERALCIGKWDFHEECRVIVDLLGENDLQVRRGVAEVEIEIEAFQRAILCGHISDDGNDY